MHVWETVTAYIKRCFDDVTVIRTIRSNQKPRLTAEVQGAVESSQYCFQTWPVTSQGQSVTGHQKSQAPVHFKDNKLVQRHKESVAGEPDHHWLQTCDDNTSQLDNLNTFFPTVWETPHLHIRSLHCDQVFIPVLRQCEANPLNAEGLCRGTQGCPRRHLPEPGCCPRQL